MTPSSRFLRGIAVLCTLSLPHMPVEAVAENGLDRIEALGRAQPLHAYREGDGVSVIALGDERGLFRIVVGAADRKILIDATGEQYAGQVRKVDDTLHIVGRVTTEQAFELLFGDVDDLVFTPDTREESPDAREETEAVIYRFSPEGGKLGVSFLGPQPGPLTFVVTRDGRYYIGNPDTDVVVSFAEQEKESTTKRASFDSDRGILTGLRGVHDLVLLDDDRRLLALNGIDGEIRVISLDTRKVQGEMASLMGEKKGWISLAPEESLSRMVVADTFRLPGAKSGKKMPFDARLGIVSYTLDPYETTDLIAFDVGALFFVEPGPEAIAATQQDAAVQITFDADGQIFALWSRISRNIVLYRMAGSYLERINIITIPEEARGIAFVDTDTGSPSRGQLLMQTRAGTYLYDRIGTWQSNNDNYAGVPEIREAQRELSVLFASSPATRLRLVDGFFGDNTERLFRLYARQQGIELPDNLSGHRNEKLAAERILASLQERSTSASAPSATPATASASVDQKSFSGSFASAGTMTERDLVTAGIVIARDPDAAVIGSSSTRWKACDLTKNDQFVLELSFGSLGAERIPVICPRVDTSGENRIVQMDFYTAEPASNGLNIQRDSMAYGLDCNAVRLYVDDKIALSLSVPSEDLQPTPRDQTRLRRVIAIQSGWGDVNDLCFGGNVSLGR